VAEPTPKTDLDTAWNGFDPAWRLALELAWQAVANGTVGVGSVITSQDGRIVASGRNSVYDPQPEAGLLHGTKLAHAEMNAFAEVPTAYDLADCTLWSTQQPCVLCAAAAMMVEIGAVRFLAADPLFSGLERMPTLDPYIADYWPRYDGPSEDDRWVVSALLLQLNAAASRNPGGRVLATSRQAEPETAQLIEQIVAEGLWIDVAAGGGTVVEALGVVWSRILAAATARRSRLG
jgi:tRNA(Arg) A34 adenosine deaminase TadA